MDLVPKKVLFLGILISIGLVLLFNYALKHHHNYDESSRFNLSQVSGLSLSRVTIDHKSRVENKLRVIANGGKDKLQVILDFDKTLSKYKDNQGNLVKTTHDVFSTIKTVPKKFKDESSRLYYMYGPIEQDPTISDKEKVPFMDQWVHEYEEIVDGIEMNSSLIQEAVKKTNLVLREGSKEMFSLLNEYSIPVLIFSAGIGDVIKATLNVNSLNMTNIHVISNFFSYTNGRIDGFKGKYIHQFNKNQRILEEIDFKYAKDLLGRSSVIVIGDSLGDAFMADGLPHTSTVLKIAFLNNKINETLRFYRETFDVVIAEDQTMDIINSIFHQILSYH